MSVYFLRICGTKLVKIGCTSRNPLERMKEIQSANPHKIELIGYIENRGQNLEFKLHKTFAYLKCEGGQEWFEADDILENFIEKFTMKKAG